MEGCKGKPSNYINKYTEANDGIVFATDGKEENVGSKNKKRNHML